jgi:hypothetical protein
MIKMTNYFYETELEWLKGRWMVEHGYTCSAPDSRFSKFNAPDLTSEEIKESTYNGLINLVPFVEEI